MKKNLLKVASLALVLILALPFCVSAFTVEEIELMSGGTVIDLTDEYYILDIDGEMQYVKEDGTIYGEYVVISYQKVDLEPYDNGETDEFFGVKVAKVKALIEVELPDGITIYSYVVVLQDVFSGAEAEAVWAANESIRSVENNCYTGLPATYIDGDVNADGIVDAFDCLIVKGIYFDSYEAAEDEITRADINSDGMIDMFDYLEVKSIYFEQDNGTISKEKIIYNPDEFHYDETADVTTTFRERYHRGLENYIETESLNGDEWFCVKLRPGENSVGTVFELNSYLAEVGFVKDEALTVSFRYNESDNSVVGYITAAMYEKMKQDNYAIECSWLPKACVDAKGC